MKGKDLKKFRKLQAALARGEPLNIGPAFSSDGWRVVMMAGPIVMLLTPALARRLAPDFLTPKAVTAGIGWIGEALNEGADLCDAQGATLQ